MDLDLYANNKHFHEEEIMIARDEKVQKTSGQRDREMDKEGQKAVGKTTMGKYYQKKMNPSLYLRRIHGKRTSLPSMN
jgi:hypothetical protein